MEDIVNPENKEFSLTSTITTIPPDYNEYTYILQNIAANSYILLLSVFIIYFIYNMFKRNSKPDDELYRLHMATFDNDMYSVMEILDDYPDGINKAQNDDKEKYTPFLRACLHGNVTLVEFMLRLGADINSKTARNENGFFLAVCNRIKNRGCKDVSCLRVLHNSGININEPNCNGLNALQLAAKFGHASLVHWLLSINANYNVEPTPLLLAEMSGHRSTILVIKNFEHGN